LFVVFCLVVVVGFCVQFVFVGLFFGLWMWFGLVFGVCLVVVVDVGLFLNYRLEGFGLYL
jgi:hypothetical protein